jgi:hypothetical protein
MWRVIARCYRLPFLLLICLGFFFFGHDHFFQFSMLPSFSPYVYYALVNKYMPAITFVSTITLYFAVSQGESPTIALRRCI